MRLAEGTRAAESALDQQARDRMDHGRLERLERGQRRQDAGQARGQHRLSRAGRAGQHQVVPSGSGDLQRALGAFLSLDVAQVLQAGFRCHHARHRRRDHRLPREVPHHVHQRAGAQHGAGVDPRGLGAGRARAQQLAVVGGGGHRGGQRTQHRYQRAVQRQLSQRDGAGDRLGRDDVQRRQQAQRDRQVEMRALLGHVGWRQVHRDALRRQRDGQGGQRRAHPVARLGHGLVGQSDDGKGRQTRADGALHLDRAGLDPLECDRVGVRDHNFPSHQQERCAIVVSTWLTCRRRGDVFRRWRRKALAGATRTLRDPCGKCALHELFSQPQVARFR